MRPVIHYLLPVLLLLAPNLFAQHFGTRQFDANSGLPDLFVYHSFRDKRFPLVGHHKRSYQIWRAVFKTTLLARMAAILFIVGWATT